MMFVILRDGENVARIAYGYRGNGDFLITDDEGRAVWVPPDSVRIAGVEMSSASEAMWAEYKLRDVLPAKVSVNGGNND
jgi:hypothetical protein